MFAGFVCYRIVANCKHKCQCELTCSYLHKCLQPMYCKLERHLFKCYCISMISAVVIVTAPDALSFELF